MSFPGIPAGNARSAALGGSTRAPGASSPDHGGWPSNRHFSTRQVAVPADPRLHDALTVVVTLQAPRCVVGSHIGFFQYATSLCIPLALRSGAFRPKVDRSMPHHPSKRNIDRMRKFAETY